MHGPTLTFVRPAVPMMNRLFRTLVLASAVIASPCAAQAWDETIQTASGPCRVWADIPGGTTFPTDAAYNRCALETPPRLLGLDPFPPAPRFVPYGGGEVTVVVRGDGTVDPGLTRAWLIFSRSWEADPDFNRQAIEAVQHWRFSPGMHGGKPVRSAFRLVIETDVASDSAPARLAWSYHPGTETDTLRGRWEPLAPLPPVTGALLDSIRVASAADLAARGEIHRGKRYCVSADAPGAETLVASRLTEFGVRAATAPACAGRRWRKLRIGSAFRLDDDRVVLFIRGDVMRMRGSGRTYAEWEARCVAIRGDEGWTSRCAARPIYPPLPLIEYMGAPGAR